MSWRLLRWRRWRLDQTRRQPPPSRPTCHSPTWPSACCTAPRVGCGAVEARDGRSEGCGWGPGSGTEQALCCLLMCLAALLPAPALLPINPSSTPITHASGNFEFGITRVMRALEPLPAHLDAPRWHAAASCLLALLDAVAKNMLVLKDALVADLLAWLEDAEVAGKGVVVVASGSKEDGGGAQQTVWSQARALRSLLMKMHD